MLMYKISLSEPVVRKKSFPLRFSPGNVIKFAGSNGFGHIY